MKVGIIGYGRLGKLIAKFLSEDYDIVVYDKIAIDQLKLDKKIQKGSMEEILSCPVLIPMVPISEFENLLLEIKDKIKPNTLIIDVCSVKEKPIEAMLKHLPQEVEILGTHPMFGPDSAKTTLFGQKIVLCPVRIDGDKFKNITSYLNSHGLKVIESSAKEHDKQIAHSLLLTHFIGRSLLKIDAKRLDIETVGYKRLMKILNTVENDSYQLFLDMNKYNRYAKETRKGLIDALVSIDGEVHD